MTDMTHLAALEIRLSNERAHASRETSKNGLALRNVWISQIEKEILHERVFLGLPEIEELPEMSIDELLAELAAA
jgi:hypothetical protein